MQKELFTEESLDAPGDDPTLYTNGDSPPVNIPDTDLPAQLTEIPEEMRTYITKETKIKLRLNPVSPLLMGKLNSSLRNPDPPRYKTVIAGGAEQWFDYDQSSIDDEDTPPEDKAAWKEYLKKTQEVTTLRSQRFMDLLMSKGIEFEMPDDDTWAEVQEEMLGIEVPPKEKKLMRKLHYLQTEVLTTNSDIQEVFPRIMAMTAGANSAAMKEAEDMFRFSLQRAQARRMDADLN